MNEQKKRELMLRFAAENDGEWRLDDQERHSPNGENLSIASDLNSIHSGKFQISKGVYGSKFWYHVCTRSEFEAFIESLFEGAPEDAEYYLPAEKIYAEGWMKTSIGERLFCLIDDNEWWETNDTRRKRTIIPRPRKQVKGLGDVVDTNAGKWLPEFNKKCLCYPRDGGECFEVTLVALDGDFFIFKHHKGELTKHSYFATDNLDTFRPLKTDAEKERERLIGDGINTVEYYSGLAKPTLKDAVEILVNSGWRPQEKKNDHEAML